MALVSLIILLLTPLSKIAEYSFNFQISAQLTGVIVAVALSAIVSIIALMICKVTVGLRVDEQQEREGLDIAAHGERAYN